MTIVLKDDFNGDGKSDILWHNSSNTFREWLVTGTTSTEPWAGSLSTNLWVEGTGDFNGDGKADLIVHKRSGVVELDGFSGTSAPSTITTFTPTLDTSWSVAAIGDLNGDGQTDVLWRTTSNFYVAWLMNGTTITTQQTLGTVPTTWKMIGSGDFNGDGKTEVVWQETGGSGPGIVEFDDIGASGFTSVGLLAASDRLTRGSWSLAFTADFDGDGKTDMLWRSSDNRTYWLYLMNGNTVASKTAINSSGQTWMIQSVGDYNGDGKAEVQARNTDGSVDIASVSASGFTVLGTIGTLDTSYTPGSSTVLPVKAQTDFDGNGRSDIFWRSTTNYAANLMINGLPHNEDENVGSYPAAWTAESLRDFNGDGKAEVLWHNTTTGAIELDKIQPRDNVAGQRLVALATIGNLDGTWSVAASGDFNGDGVADILWKDTNSVYREWLMNTDTTHSEPWAGTIPTYWDMVGSGDFNGDGKQEVLWHSNTTGQVEIDSLGAGGFTYLGTPDYLDNSWSVAAIGDFNGDGKSDILWKTSSNFYVEWLMDGAKATAEKTLGTIPGNWQVEAAGDYLGNGIYETAWRDSNSLKVEFNTLTDAGLISLGTMQVGSAGWHALAGK